MENLRALTESYLSEINNKLADLPVAPDTIYRDLTDFVNNKSKRIRSVLCLLYLQADNLKISNPVITLLSASELIHNASLLHDDVIDDSQYRRGEEAFRKKYNDKMSVLSGDYLLSLAVKQLMELNNSDILHLFLNTTSDMSKAEIKQYLNRDKETDINDYLKIISGKTASLFKATLKSAVILTNGDCDKAESFGELFGMLYQINNDMQPESEENDKLNGVKTAINILGIEKTLSLKDNYKHKIREIIKTFTDTEYKKGLEDLINKL